MKTPPLLIIGLVALAAATTACSTIASDSSDADGAAVATVASDKTVKPVALTIADFDAKTASGVVLVDFWDEWCHPCHMIAPTLEKLAAEYEGKVLIAKVDVASESELAERFNISAIPHLKILKDGKVVDEVIGLTSKAEIAKKLDAQLCTNGS